MDIDFSQLGRSSNGERPVDPIEIFEKLPSLSGTVNDLWRGQADALNEWNANRTEKDILVSLNTGAGKTIVGVLIAQSLVNEKIPNVIYLCSTKDLVKQTKNEAEKIGISCTTLLETRFSNELFETEKGFCITTYASLFNGFSRLRRRNFPEAIIFDDAHVAEKMLRDAFTLKISKQNDAVLFNEIVRLFKPHFEEIGIPSRFDDALDEGKNSAAFVAPNGLFSNLNSLFHVLVNNGIENHPNMKFPFNWMKDRMHAYAGIFCRGQFELTPPFLPSRSIDVFERDMRRVYLSATLQSKTDFIRSFGRKPDKIISPLNDAGNGERLIINGRKVTGGFGTEFTKNIVENNKVLIAVSSSKVAESWRDIAVPSSELSDFSEQMSAFRESNQGAFLLVSRVDGIDLPHGTCRIMIMEGLPIGTSLLERYQWEFLHMQDTYNIRIANRLAQLFGRINRGRNDFGAFLIQGRDLAQWVSTERMRSLLPPLLHQQIIAGEEVQERLTINNAERSVNLIEKVLSRNEGWIDYYQRTVSSVKRDQDQIDRHNAAEPVMVEAALSEAKYAAAMWNNDPTLARRELEKTVNTITTHDKLLGGWHWVWLGATYDLEGDSLSARRAYVQAMDRLGNYMKLPRPLQEVNVSGEQEMNPFGHSLKDLLLRLSGDKFTSELNKIKNSLSYIIEGNDTNKAEEATRILGELLGFNSIRPDNDTDTDTGPDGLWLDDSNMLQLGFELKTGKFNGRYSKDEINQSLGHLSWMKNNYPNHSIVGLIIVGHDGEVGDQANPAPEMSLCLPSSMESLRDELIALVDDLRSTTQSNMEARISTVSQDERWSLMEISKRLEDKKLLG